MNYLQNHLPMKLISKINLKLFNVESQRQHFIKPTTSSISKELFSSDSTLKALQKMTMIRECGYEIQAKRARKNINGKISTRVNAKKS